MTARPRAEDDAGADGRPGGESHEQDGFPADPVRKAAERVGEDRGGGRENEVEDGDEARLETRRLGVEEKERIGERAQGEDGVEDDVESEVPVDVLERKALEEAADLAGPAAP